MFGRHPRLAKVAYLGLNSHRIQNVYPENTMPVSYHPSKTQLEQVLKRHSYALDMSKSIDDVSTSCHTCASLKQVPNSLVKQSSEDPPEAIGTSFAADVLKRNRQIILVVRKTMTSFTTVCLLENERHDTLRDGLIHLIVGLHTLDGPPATIRVDPAPGFTALRNDESLRGVNLVLDIGRIKNVNKNTVAEKAIAELESEILRQDPTGDTLTAVTLSLAIARLNSRIRFSGPSSQELF